MRPPSPRLPAIKIDADVVPRQVQHLTPQPPVLLDLRLGFRRPSGKFPRPFADLDYPAHGCRERRVLKLEMNTEARTEVRAAIGDHVDALHDRNRLDIFQALERLDQHANDDIGIGPWRIPRSRDGRRGGRTDRSSQRCIEAMAGGPAAIRVMLPASSQNFGRPMPRRCCPNDQKMPRDPSGKRGADERQSRNRA
jgi:hypothetical protein